MSEHPLREFANRKPCMVRAPAICTFDDEETVLAHIRRGSAAGTGQKPPDICGVWACFRCHALIDRRDYKDVPIEVVNDYTLDALVRQLAWYDKHEIIAVVL